MANSNNRLLLLLTMLALAITIITASSSFSEPSLSYAQTLGNIKDLSTDATDAHNAEVSVSGSNIYVIWIDFRTGNDDVYFKRSTDGGASFDDTINLSNNAGDSYNFKLSLIDDTIHIVWQDETSGVDGSADVYFKRSIDGGASFDDTINLSNNAGDSTDPDISSTINGSVYVAWRDNSAGLEQILFRKSNDRGISFGTGLSEYLVLSNNSANNINAIEPQIASDNNNNLYVIWSQGNFYRGISDIFFRRSTNGGASFSDIINLSSNPNSRSSLATIRIIENNIYTAWSDGPFNNGQVNYRRSTDNGASFSDIINLSSNTGNSISPEIGVFRPNVFVVWQNQVRNGTGDIFLRGSTDNGANFSDIINLSSNTGNSISPEISMNNSSAVYIVWQNKAKDNETYDIFLRGSTDNGANFSDIINLSSNTGNSISPDIACTNDGIIYVVWTDNINGRSRVFFSVLR